MIWNDINIFKRDYTNGIKKLEGITEDYNELQNEKLKHNHNAFNTTPDIDEYGLDDKYTIRPFKLHYNHGLKDLFKNKCTPSNTLKGKINLSTGTKEIIKMTNKMIPKIDHSTVDPGYYEYKMNDINSNKDLMMKRISNADAFAKSYVTDWKTKTNNTIEEHLKSRLQRIGTNTTLDAGSVHILKPSPLTLQPPAEPLDVTTKNKRLLTGKGFGLNISPIKSNESILEEDFNEHFNDLEDNFDNILQEEDKDNKRIQKKNERLKKFKELAGRTYKNNMYDEIIKGAEESKQRHGKIKEITKNNASKRINKFISNVIEKNKANKGKARSNSLSESVAGFLEESDSESDTEADPKPEAKIEGKKKKQTKEDKEDSFKNIVSSLTPDMLHTGIQFIDKEIKEYEKENKKHVILKETSDYLNKKLALYGLKFKTGTLVSSVLKRLNDHKLRLENQYDTGQIEGRLVDLKSEGKYKEAKKAENI